MSSVLVRALLKYLYGMQMHLSNRCPKVSLNLTPLEEEEEFIVGHQYFQQHMNQPLELEISFIHTQYLSEHTLHVAKACISH